MRRTKAKNRGSLAWRPMIWNERPGSSVYFQSQTRLRNTTKEALKIKPCRKKISKLNVSTIIEAVCSGINTDQWHRTENQKKILIFMANWFVKGAKTIPPRKNGLHKKWCCHDSVSRCKRRDLGPYHIWQMKINSTWIRDLNVRTKGIKFLEKNTGENLCDLGLEIS